MTDDNGTTRTFDWSLGVDGIWVGMTGLKYILYIHVFEGSKRLVTISRPKADLATRHQRRKLRSRIVDICEKHEPGGSLPPINWEALFPKTGKE